MASLFFSYSHKDEALRDQLEVQLAMLKRQGVISTWHDRRIGAGDDLHGAISDHVERDQVILLLVSPDFLASDYCYDVEMTRALERQTAGEAVVIPVILRPCDWQGAPFGRLMATPPDGRPVTQWPDRDQAFLEVAKSIRRVVEALATRRPAPTGPAAAASATAAAGREPTNARPAASPRSSNLALAKRFTDRDRDAFLIEAFEYTARFFECSIAELAARNPGVEGDFRRVDANRFLFSAYRDGKVAARGTVFMGGAFGPAISYVHQHTTDSNTYNESMRVADDDQSLFMRASGSSHVRGGDGGKLTFEGAAELYWAMFVRPLQQR